MLDRVVAWFAAVTVQAWRGGRQREPRIEPSSLQDAADLLVVSRGPGRPYGCSGWFRQERGEDWCDSAPAGSPPGASGAWSFPFPTGGDPDRRRRPSMRAGPARLGRCCAADALREAQDPAPRCEEVGVPRRSSVSSWRPSRTRPGSAATCDKGARAADSRPMRVPTLSRHRVAGAGSGIRALVRSNQRPHAYVARRRRAGRPVAPHAAAHPAPFDASEK